MTIKDAKSIFNLIAFNKGMFNFDWKEYTFTDGEVEYQLRDYTNGNFSSILVKLCNDTTHTYREFFEYNYTDENLYELFYDVLDDNVIEQLINMENNKLRRLNNDKKF